MTIKTKSYPEDHINELLKEQGIFVNHYAEVYFSHPRFSKGHSEEINVTVAALKEIGLENGATLEEVFTHISEMGFQPCAPDTGLFLRLAWKDQPQSQNSVLSGTHSSPDQAVTVLSEVLEENDDFPKGLYLRNVDGVLWLRGYICDSEYRFPGVCFSIGCKQTGRFRLL